MKLLLDTNIFLEIILDQEKSPDAKALLSKSEENEFFISDYSLHSIGLLLFGLKQHDVFRQFLMDMMINVGVIMISLSVENMIFVLKKGRVKTGQLRSNPDASLATKQRDGYLCYNVQGRIKEWK